MTKPASLRFLSLFVSDLGEATGTYQALLGVSRVMAPRRRQRPHPFAARGPVVFQLGDVALALYQCDGRTTHPGDVGFGIETAVDEAAARVREHGGQVFWGPRSLDGQDARWRWPCSATGIFSSWSRMRRRLSSAASSSVSAAAASFPS